jgi:hypothetical protein
VTNERLGVATRAKPVQVFLIALVAVLIGLFVPGWVGAAVLFAIAAGLLALLVVGWRAATPATLVIRAVILAALVLIALSKL